MTEYRNIDEALRGLLRDIFEDGSSIPSRNGPTLELTSRTFILSNPCERFITTAGRNSNPFAAIAETMWVLSGRNDLAFLTPYLKRAPDFSDDGGSTWRAGYGPRLRNWHGIDQLESVYTTLRSDPSSRRATIILFDPAIDFGNFRDVPCNNWIHFLIRDGSLDVNVAARSSDVWWGLSGINCFEWSVLLEMMASWLGVRVGKLTYFSSSIHLYAVHVDRAREHLRSTRMDQQRFPSSHYETGWEDAERRLQVWMGLEAGIRDGNSIFGRELPFQDPLLTSYIKAIDLYWSFKRGDGSDEVEKRLAALGTTDVSQACAEFISRPNAHLH